MDSRVLDGLAQAKLVTSESAGSAGAHADQFSREHLLLLSDDRSPRRACARAPCTSATAPHQRVLTLAARVRAPIAKPHTLSSFDNKSHFVLDRVFISSIIYILRDDGPLSLSIGYRGSQLSNDE